ncbi:MAG: YceI family protein [Leptospiraceae bacterium]|nr:YceI family protein [Leptospiraceae bacterium]MDW8307454.1 YceI family protein [Leptospiraceae bacterium]
MQRKVSFGWIVLFLLACAKPPQAQKADARGIFPVAKPEGKEVALDVEKSVIKWIGTKITGRHNGTVKLKSGSVYINRGFVTAGRFVVDMTTITNLDLEGEFKAKLEKHLKSPDFFDVEKYPEAVFEIAAVVPGKDSDRVQGNLTMRGVTHGIEFDAHLEREAGTIKRAHAVFNIDRQKWGVAYKGKPDDLISDIVNLELDLYTKK